MFSLKYLLVANDLVDRNFIIALFSGKRVAASVARWHRDPQIRDPGIKSGWVGERWVRNESFDSRENGSSESRKDLPKRQQELTVSYPISVSSSLTGP